MSEAPGPARVGLAAQAPPRALGDGERLREADQPIVLPDHEAALADQPAGIDLGVATDHRCLAIREPAGLLSFVPGSARVNCQVVQRAAGRP
jgi:hypothetical protein